MTGSDGPTFEKIGRWELADGGDEFPPSVTVRRTVTRRPRSEAVTVECAYADCNAAGVAERYETGPTFCRCPDCGREAMVPRK